VGQDDAKVTIYLRPEDVVVSAEAPVSKVNVFEGDIHALVFLGEIIDCQIKVEGEIIRARIHPKSVFKTGQRVFIEAAPSALIIIGSD
jgi:ABC-type sugar transport system ATPase subunit